MRFANFLLASLTIVGLVQAAGSASAQPGSGRYRDGPATAGPSFRPPPGNPPTSMIDPRLQRSHSGEPRFIPPAYMPAPAHPGRSSQGSGPENFPVLLLAAAAGLLFLWSRLRKQSSKANSIGRLLKLKQADFQEFARLIHRYHKAYSTRNVSAIRSLATSTMIKELTGQLAAKTPF